MVLALLFGCIDLPNTCVCAQCCIIAHVAWADAYERGAGDVTAALSLAQPRSWAYAAEDATRGRRAELALQQLKVWWPGSVSALRV